MGMIKHSQSTQSNKLQIYLQYLKKDVKDGIHVFHTNRHQSFYKLTLSFLMEVARHVLNTQKKEVGNIFAIDQEKSVTCKRFKYFMGVQSCSLILVIDKINFSFEESN